MVIIIVTQFCKLFWIVKIDLSKSSVILSFMLYCKSSSIRIINSWHKNHCALRILKFTFNPRLLIFGGTKGQIVPKKLSLAVESPKKQTDSFILFSVKSSYIVNSNSVHLFSGRVYLDNILSNYSMKMNTNSKGQWLYCSKQYALSSAVWYMGMMADVVEYYWPEPLRNNFFRCKDHGNTALRPILCRSCVTSWARGAQFKSGRTLHIKEEEMTLKWFKHKLHRIERIY